MYLQRILSTAAFAALLLTGCKKEEEVNTQNLSPMGPYTTLSAALLGQTEPVQVVNADADSGGSYVLRRGTRIVVPRRAFRTAAGDTVRGTVQLTVKEFVDRAEMIYGNVLTTTADDETALISGGALLFYAEQKGLVVHLNTPSGIEAYLPQRNLLLGSTFPLQGYYGSRSEAPIQRVYWNPSFRNNSTAYPAADTIVYRFDTSGYHMPASPYNVLNPGINQDTVRFSLSGVQNLNTGTSALYLLPKNVRSVIRLGDIVSLRNKDFYVLDGTEVNLVGIGVVNGYFQGGISTVKFENRKNYSVQLFETTPADFKKRIQDLL